MAKIDFDPDSAPLSGAIMPSIEDINRLSDVEDRIVWRSPSLTPSARGFTSPMLVALCVGLVCFVAWSLLVGPTPTARARPVGVSAKAPLDTASSIYAVLRTPKTSDFLALNAAVTRGADVSLVCPTTARPADDAPEPLFNRFDVEENQISAEGYIIDGFRWFSIDKTGAAGQ